MLVDACTPSAVMRPGQRLDQFRRAYSRRPNNSGSRNLLAAIDFDSVLEALRHARFVENLDAFAPKALHRVRAQLRMNPAEDAVRRFNHHQPEGITREPAIEARGVVEQKIL